MSQLLDQSAKGNPEIGLLSHWLSVLLAPACALDKVTR